MAGQVADFLVSLKGRCLLFFRRRCLAGFPWYWPARPPGQYAMVEARRTVRRHFGRDHHPALRTIAKILVTIAWPPAVLVNLLQARYMMGPDAMPINRAAGALWVAIRHNILPTEYYAYGLWRGDRRRDIDSYLFANESSRLFKVLNRPLERDPIGDKLAFHEMCKAHDLPTPAVLAAFAPTGKLMDFAFGRPPQQDLFVKASSGNSFAERFRWHGADFESDCGCRLSREELGAYLANRARIKNQTLVVQPVLSNHPDLRVESSGALATVRLVTGRSVNDEVIPIFSFILFGLPNRIEAHSNCVTLIDVATGRLMPAPPRKSPAMSMYQYREFGLNDACTLPDWDLALCHIKVAHKVCSNFVFVGWDVAFTERGPMILEGNVNWDAATFQTLRDEPLGYTKFADILATRLTSERGTGK